QPESRRHGCVLL
nr:immunoglobulin heavy chain junction region [Homo sapiens]